MPVVIGELKVYEVPELAELFDVNERTVRMWLREGVFKGTKLGGKWYVSEEDLQAAFRPGAGHKTYKDFEEKVLNPMERANKAELRGESAEEYEDES